MKTKRIGFVVMGDFLAFWLSLFLILVIRYGETHSALVLKHLEPFFILYVAWTLIFFIFDLYDMFTIRPTIPHLRRFGLALIVSFLLGIILFYLIPFFGISPKTNLIFQVILFGILSFANRRFFYTFYSKSYTRPAVLIGSSSCMQQILSTILINPHLGLRALAHSEDIDEMIDDYSDTKNVLFIIEKINGKVTDEHLSNLYKKGVEVIDVVQAYERYLQKIPVRHIDQTWVVENIQVKENILYVIARKIIDIVFAVCVLIVFSPVVLVAIIAKLIEDGHPIFIKQKRVSKNNKIFNLYKIRSMVVLSPDGSAETGKATWSTGPDDPRITPVGKVLRKTHIDEIPQMINILRGDITLIGPRPERPEFVSELEQSIPYYDIRHSIRPGFTGWAQIKYRYARTNDESKEKFEYDLYYIKNRNIFIDFGIFLRTVQIIFTH